MAATDHFTPHTPLTRALLERYAQGLLEPEESHAVELHLEEDALLREALEGLRQPGALAGLHQLHRPSRSAPWGPISLALVVLACGAGLYWFNRPDTAPDAHRGAAPLPQAVEQAAVPAAVESTLHVVHAELREVVRTRNHPAPATTPELFRPDPPETVERRTVDRIGTPPATVARTTEPIAPKRAHAAGNSRRLVFLHGLKLVHPQELPAAQRPHLPSPGTPANIGPPTSPAAMPLVGRERYLDFMDGAMASIAKANYPSALDRLYLVLDQYPHDVNAQFYAGLACFRSGLYRRALGLFHDAANNPIDSFAEEARWYAAMSTLRADGPEAAMPLLERIAEQGGFYADQAREALEQNR